MRQKFHVIFEWPLIPVFLSIELSPIPTSLLKFDRSLDVEVSQRDEGNENREDELEDVSEPDDVVRVQTKFGSFNLVPRYIGLQMVKLE